MDRGGTARILRILDLPLRGAGSALPLLLGSVLVAGCSGVGSASSAAHIHTARSRLHTGDAGRTRKTRIHTQLRRVANHDAVTVPVLIYHHVKLLKPSDDAIERGLTVLPGEFEAELAYLSRAHYHTVTAAQVVAFLRSGYRLPSRPVVLSFDDGYRDMAGMVYHLLRRRHLRATFFIVPGFLNSPRYLSWGQVEDMARHGMDIEAHTMTHPDLTLVSMAQVHGELSESRRVLQARLHRPVRIFAYPYGDYNASVLDAVRAAGFWAAFTTHQGWVARRTSMLTLPRVYVDLDDTVPIFAGRLRADARVLAEDPT